MQIGFIVILIIAIFVAIFAIQNGTPVPVDLFFARYEMPLAVIMMICLILGAVIILILGTTRQFKKRSEHNELKNKLRTLEGEKAKQEIDIKTLETEKAKLQTNQETIETEKQNLQNEITEFSEKVTLLEDKIKLQEEEIVVKNQEIDMLKAQNIDVIQGDTEITDEGAIQINNENSEVESQ
ncbi:MAG: lipopolysaccharide assembly protein LapA domain-containing protein [Tissierellia bacterium]|nr:lipopolysaccharide assembly protein LapA domain-containing protein [Tissierellia bacterium]MDD4436612.1 lipopolysaccharide assembly protein LapA domain-containing protein [Tissierellia bacterium]